MLTVEERIKESLSRLGLMKPGMLLIAACSGGRDSITLLHALTHAAGAETEIVAVYIHHGLRSEADDEETWLKDLCAAWKVPYQCRHVDVRNRKMQEGETLEEAARKLRYQALQEIGEAECRRRDCSEYRILTAHHADDQAETVLMNLLRGSALDGLGAMKETSGRIVRPMLQIGREEIDRYIREHGLSYREDASNADETYTRNWIRHRLIPLMREKNPQIVRNLSRMTRALQADETYLEEKAAEERIRCTDSADPSVLKTEALLELPDALRIRVLRQYLEQNGGLKDISEKHLSLFDDFLKAESGKELDLTQRVLRMNNHRIRCIAREAYRSKLEMTDSAAAETTFCIVPRDGLTVKTPFGTLSFTECPNPGRKVLEISESSYTKWMSCDIFNLCLCLRTRRSGDYIRIPGGTQTLQDLMVNRKVDRLERDRMPVLMHDSECLWIPGLRMSRSVWVKPEDPKAVQVHFQSEMK